MVGKLIGSSAAALIIAASLFTAGCGGSSTVNENSQGEAMRATDEMLEVGMDAPDFSVSDDEGNMVNLADFRGKKGVVLIFYPMNETPGCTSQLCAARDAWADYQTANVQVFGVNPATEKSHRSFSENHSFPFPLLADTEKQIVKSYGCEGLLATKRTVYGIDKDGKIVFAQRGMPSTQEILAPFKEG